MGPAQPHGTGTRQGLIDAALKVVLERGFARATTKEIAKAAGVAEGTIYRHFADKEALFHEVILSVTRTMEEELGRLPALAGRASVRDNLAYLFQLIGGMVRQLSSLVASVADPDISRGFASYLRTRSPETLVAGPVSRLVEYIRAEQELGRIRGDVDPVEAAGVIISVPFAPAIERALGALVPAPDLPAPARGALDILARGLAPEDGVPADRAAADRVPAVRAGADRVAADEAPAN